MEADGAPDLVLQEVLVTGLPVLSLALDRLDGNEGEVSAPELFPVAK